MANIRDVARMAKVSPATVSRILNDNQVYKTTDETRERVLRAVTELGYQPLARKEVPSCADSESRFSVSGNAVSGFTGSHFTVSGFSGHGDGFTFGSFFITGISGPKGVSLC